MSKNITLAFLACLALSTPALAEDKDSMAGMDHSTMKMESSKTDLYSASRDKMHKDMMVAPTGNADKDFVLNMLPHHQGAVDMAKVELQHGKDPELKKLAQHIVDAQEKEIAQMKDWLKMH